MSAPELTITAARRGIAAGELGPVELTRSALERIDALNGELNAYLYVDREGALEQAAAAERRVAAGDDAPLLGIPVCVKDVLDVAGMPTTAGADGWVRHPEVDAPSVARLRAAGAILIGKGNTNEFAFGIDGRNPHRGDCRNPHDPTRISGGSTAGPAVAAATGMALGGVGTDTSGSLRVPASLCGLASVRPSLGSVPTTGVVPLAWSYDTVGPIARTVPDADLLLSVLAGLAPALAEDASTLPGGLRVVVLDELAGPACEPAVAGLFDAALERLGGLGAAIERVSVPMLARVPAMHRLIQGAEAARAHAPWFDEQRERYAPGVRARLEAGSCLTAGAYLKAQQARRLLLQEVAEAVAGGDAILAPATPLPAPRLDAQEVTLPRGRVPLRVALLSLTLTFNQLGSPVVTVPMGLADGLPVGLQVAGRPGSEAQLLRIAAVLEHSSG